MMTALFIVAVVGGFYMAWNIGANDVANAFGTSVGSKALTFRQAVVVAAVFEFAGAILVGSHVTGTIRSGLFDPRLLVGREMTLGIGMVAALLGAGIWLQISTHLGYPVSTTHSIVGAIVGFALVVLPFHAIKWGLVGRVVASWIVSPIVGALLGWLIFMLLKGLIFNRADPLVQSRRAAPFLLFSVFFILCMSFLYKGLKQLHLDFGPFHAILISSAVGFVAGLVGWALLKGTNGTAAPYGERLDAVEELFRHLQIVTACTVAFAHGANDVANAVGPLAAVVALVKSGQVMSKVPVPVWVLALGGAGIVTGLATFGYRVIRTVGTKITAMNPSRGFSAEFGGAVTVLFASRLGLPISTTHVIVGAVIGVGLARGVVALDLKVIKEIVVTWVVTVPAAAIVSIACYYILRLVFL
ncbi:MAG: inorganic phosphate transporter [Acidobacteria bacterium]|nr:inorganic phosphate transporter [Acidobacteriota bacterium]